MSLEESILAPESLEMILHALDGLGPALGPEAASELGRVRAWIESAIAAGADGRQDDAIEAISAAMQELGILATKMDPAEAAAMQAVAGQFSAAMVRGDRANAAEKVEEMRKRSGAIKRRPEDTDL